MWDPTLGRFRAPTGDELAASSQRSRQAAEMIHAERLRIEQRPDGSMLLRVPENGFGATWGRFRSEGTAEMRCAHSSDEAPAHHATDLMEEK